MAEVRTSSMEERLKKLREAPETPKYSSNPKIQNVPFMLRDPKTFDKYYEPRAVAMDPFHHGNPKCELAEEFKLMMTKIFLEYTSRQKAEDVHHKIDEKVKELRDCYAEEATKCYDEETLAWMLFIDGCSTLQFMHSFVHKKLEQLSIRMDQIAFVRQDLFLLENQVPYKVLELLMSSSDKREELKDSIEIYVRANIGAPAKKKSKEQEQKQSNEAIRMEKEPAHLLDLLRRRMLGPRKEVPDNPAEDHSVQSFHNVRELNAAGIHFKCSNSSFLGDISFVSHCFAGFLCLPPISVDDSTGPKFMNLIAYEMCPGFHTDFGVTSYIKFLSALIDHANDVKKLRSVGVLYNLLGSDKKVAEIFNELRIDLVPNTHIYCDVIAGIENHYKTKWKTWISRFFYHHFSSPWTFLACLTSIQTWFTSRLHRLPVMSYART